MSSASKLLWMSLLSLAGCGEAPQPGIPQRVTCDFSSPASTEPCALSPGQQVHERLDRYREENFFRIELPPARRVVTLNLEATKSEGEYLQVFLGATTPDGAALVEAQINDAVSSGELVRRIELPGSELRVRVAFGGMTQAGTYTLTIE